MASKGEEYGDENLIHVKVTGLRANSGEVICSLFTSAEGFPLRKSAQRGVGVISGGSSECDFQGEDTGRYAVAVLDHLNVSSGGVPHGGIGVSNNPAATGGLPTFDAAAFAFRGGSLELTIDMRYQ